MTTPETVADVLKKTPTTPEGWCAYRMDGYYIHFEMTGLDIIDNILSAIACAGKAFHHTESWNDDASPESYGDRLRGANPVHWIQNAACEARDRLESALAAGAEPVAIGATGCVHHDFSILNSYIRNLRWSHDTPNEIRDAVAANLRGLYTHILTRGLFAGSGSWDAGRLAAAKWIEKRRCAFADEYGLVDPTTGVLEFGNGYPERDEYYCELSEIEEAIRALPAPQFVAHAQPAAPAESLAEVTPAQADWGPLDVVRHALVSIASYSSDPGARATADDAIRAYDWRDAEPVASVPDGMTPVSEGLPPENELVLVYTPDENEIDGGRYDFDYIEDGGWQIHAGHYEHFMVVGGHGAAGPDAPYTHWSRLPKLKRTQPTTPEPTK